MLTDARHLLTQGSRYDSVQCRLLTHPWLLRKMLRSAGSASEPVMVYPVLLLARELDGGGSERQLAEIAIGLDQSRFEPFVGTFRPAGLRGEQLRAAKVPVVHFPVMSFRSVGALKGAWQMARFVRKRGIRLVHSFDAPTTTFATPVVRYLTRAVMLTSQRGHRMLTPEYREFLRWTDRRTDGIVVNCEYMKRHLVEDENIDPAMVQVCPNGIDLERFHPAAPDRPAQLPAGAFVIGVVSMLRPEKDIATLIRAFAQVRRLDFARRLVIVGSGPEREHLHQSAREAGVADDCLWVPATMDVASWLRNFDIFVLPSRNEAFPNALMEAMACGCAVIASNVGGVPELVQDGCTGLLFEAGNIEALAGALRRLIENEALRARLASAGEQFVREHLSRHASAERMGEIYSKAIARRG